MTPRELAIKFIEDLELNDMSNDEAVASLTNRVILLVQDYQAAAVQVKRAALEQAQKKLEQIRREALARLEAADKDRTLDSDTAAWLLEVSQDIEAMQVEAQDAAIRARNAQAEK